MTYQCKHVLKCIKQLSKNTDMHLRFTSDGTIYPFSSDTPSADCSKYKKEIVSIMRELHKQNYIALDGYRFQLTQQGIHTYQHALEHIFKIIYDKWIPFFALIISILSLAKSYGIDFKFLITLCMRLLRIESQ